MKWNVDGFTLLHCMPLILCYVHNVPVHYSALAIEPCVCNSICGCDMITNLIPFWKAFFQLVKPAANNAKRQRITWNGHMSPILLRSSYTSWLAHVCRRGPTGEQHVSRSTARYFWSGMTISKKNWRALWALFSTNCRKESKIWGWMCKVILCNATKLKCYLYIP